MTGAESPILLSMRNIHVAYEDTKALNGVDFDLYRGEIHALVGEHRAGKSSLVKLLCGAERRKEGEILLEGRKLGHLSPKSARELGIGMVYQDLTIIPDLNAVENVFTGRMLQKTSLTLDYKEMTRRTRELFDRIGTEVDCHAPLYRLPMVQQHMVELARALLLGPKVLILDELSNKLTPEEMKKIYRVVFELKNGGGSVIYISHDMDEVLKLADRVTILKGGYRRETASVKNLDRFRLFQLTYSFTLNEQKLEFAGTKFELLKRYLENIIQNFPIGVILLDESLRVELINYSAVDMLGLGRDPAKRRPFRDILKFGEPLLREMAETMEKKAAGSWDEIRGEGEKLFKLDLFPLRDEEGSFIGTTAVLQDISMDKYLNDYLIQSEKIASVAEVAVGVAHEINNPLFIIQNYVELIKTKAEDRDVQEKIAKIEAELGRIVEIVTSLLSFSRIKNLPDRRVNLREILDDVLILLLHQLSEKLIRVEKRYPADDVFLVGDENRLKQVFLNLVGNSIEAVLDHGFVEIDLRADGGAGYAEVLIKDDGSGIPEEVSDKVFNPFFSTKVSKKNTGLGLSICRHIVEEHHGTIDFTSTPGKQTIFRVRLPLTAAEDQPA